jgi:type II secretory pathway pseudopilin PulG
LNNEENKMKLIAKKSDKKIAFTIIELLTVMSIIVILIGLLLPSLTMVKRHAKEVKQRAQFHSIEAALEIFSGDNEYGSYPPSNAQDEDGQEYCGAMKLCEAMVGQDLAGFHPLSHFRADCTTDGTFKLYANNPTAAPLSPDTQTNLKARRGPFLQPDSANAYRLGQLYEDTGDFSGDLFVLCDVYNRVRNRDTGRGIGMPILYYKAHTSNTIHDPNGSLPIVGDDAGYIYNYTDNDKLVLLPPPFDPTGTHPMGDAARNFYDLTRNDKVTIQSGWPYRPNTYILISAGFDGLYGTDDDIFNFEK